MINKKILISKETIKKLRKCNISYKKLSDIFNCTIKTIWNWINQKFTVYNKRGRKSKINNEIGNEIINFIENKVTITQNDIINLLYEKYNIKINQSNISRFLKKNNISRKKITKKYSEKKDISDWIESFKNIDKDLLMSMDECAFLMNETPRYGYSRRNKRAIISEPGNKGKRYTLVLCVSNKKENSFVKYTLFEGSLKSFSFCDFISDIDRKNIILLDNASCHKNKMVNNLIEKPKLYYLPPYQPELNPTEHCFSVIKNYVRNKKPRNFEDLKNSIDIAIKKLCCDNKVYNMFKHCLF